MNIDLEVRDAETQDWWLIGRFEYGIYAMECARALSEGDDRAYRVADRRMNADEPLIVVYEKGAAW